MSTSQRITIALLILFCVVLTSVGCALFFLSRADQSQDTAAVQELFPVTTAQAHTSETLNTNNHSANTNNANINTPPPVFQNTQFALFSSELIADSQMPELFTCDGEGRMPHFTIEHVPKKSVTLAFIMHDPDISADIRADSTWYHLIMWNIPFTTTELSHTLLPESVVYGTNTSGSREYVPPCPPDTTHRYIFTLYALDSAIDLGTGAQSAEFFEAIQGHVIKKTSFTTTYNRHEKTITTD